jgi:hypothetical protein
VVVALLPDAQQRRDGGEGDTRLARAQEDGQLQPLLGPMSASAVSCSLGAYSECVLPWTTPTEGGDASEALAAVQQCTRELLEHVSSGQHARLLDALSVKADEDAAAIAKRCEATLRSVQLGAHPLTALIAKAADGIAAAAGTVESKPPAEAIAVLRTALEVAAAELSEASLLRGVERWALERLRSNGAAGWRAYAKGQRLVVCTGGAWVDAVVETPADRPGDAHRITVGLKEPSEALALHLHPWNHAPMELPCADFEAVRARYAHSMRAQHATIVDPLSGVRLDVRQQCVSIEVTAAQGETGGLLPEWRDVHGLAEFMVSLHAQRCRGDAGARGCLLLTAPPAAGKSCLMQQLITIVGTAELVPILVRVQRLQRLLLMDEHRDTFARAWNWVDAYLRCTHGEQSDLYRLLRQAMAARRALLLLDGIDEGGTNRDAIERHVTEVLAPQGHLMLVTSRPAGLREERFAAHFLRLRLGPLTEVQQQEVVARRVTDAEQRAALVEYMGSKVPLDTETEVRITANPLMLSMVISVFLSRGGKGMPKTVAELYETASRAMLERVDRKERGAAAAAASANHLARLLQAVFFEAHVTQRRVIEDRQLDEAALSLDAPSALAAIRAAHAPFAYEGRAEKGHYVEVVAGEHMGKRGVITRDDKSGSPYKVTFADGATSGWLYRRQLKSSGLDEAAFHTRAAERVSAAQVREACAALPEAAREALAEVRDRVSRDALPLLSLLQTEPLQLQSSHLSIQEYFAACALRDGTRLSGAPPWQWPAWWANTVAIGEEMGEPFAKGSLRAAGVEGDALDLNQKLGGDRPTVLRVVALFTRVLTSCEYATNCSLACLSIAADISIRLASTVYCKTTLVRSVQRPFWTSQKANRNSRRSVA